MVTVNFETFKKEWISQLEGLSKSTKEKKIHIAKKLFSQWLDIEQEHEDFEPASEIGFEFAYYYEGVEQEENSSEEYIWYLVFCDYSNEVKEFKEVVKKLTKDISDYLFNKNLFTNLQSLKKQILEFSEEIKKGPSYKIKLVVASLEEKNRDKFIKLKEEEDFQYYFLDFISIQTIYNRIVDENTRSAIFAIKAQLNKFGENLLIGSIGLKELYDFLFEYQNKIGDLDLVYQKNVRKYLGSRNKVNKEISKTILEKPETFSLYNNGITMVVGGFEDKGNGVYELIEPFIVNGCQTSKTIWETLSYQFSKEKNDKSPWFEKLKNSTVVLKIVDIGSGEHSQELLKDITRYTNSQTVVKNRDFLSLENEFREFHKVFAQKYGVYLEIQRGGWDSQIVLQKQNPNITPYFQEYSNAFDLIKVYAAGWLKEVGKPTHLNAPFSPGGSIFKKITSTENPNQIDADDLYACHLLQKEANEIGFGRQAKEAWKSRTKYLFYFTIIKILEDILIKLKYDPQLNKKIITKAILHIFRNYPDLKEGLITNAQEVIEEYMTEGKEESIFYEENFSKFKEIKDFLRSKDIGKTKNYTSLIQIQLRAMKKSINGKILYNSLLEKLEEISK